MFPEPAVYKQFTINPATDTIHLKELSPGRFFLRFAEHTDDSTVVPLLYVKRAKAQATIKDRNVNMNFPDNEAVIPVHVSTYGATDRLFIALIGGDKILIVSSTEYKQEHVGRYLRVDEKCLFPPQRLHD